MPLENEQEREARVIAIQKFGAEIAQNVITINDLTYKIAAEDLPACLITAAIAILCRLRLEHKERAENLGNFAIRTLAMSLAGNGFPVDCTLPQGLPDGVHEHVVHNFNIVKENKC